MAIEVAKVILEHVPDGSGLEAPRSPGTASEAPS